MSAEVFFREGPSQKVPRWGFSLNSILLYLKINWNFDDQTCSKYILKYYKIGESQNRPAQLEHVGYGVINTFKRL